MYKLEWLGICLELKGKDEDDIPITEDGRVGYLEAGYSVTLTVLVDGPNTWVVEVDGKKNVTVRHPLADAPAGTYPTKIHLHESETSASAYTQYPANHVRLLRYIDDGVVEMWEVALISQDGCFWATSQKTYDIACGRSEIGEFLCPRFEQKWPQLVEVLERLLEGKELSHEIARFKEKPVSKGPTNRIGSVVWWNYAQQLGAIATGRGQVRVHWSQIIAPNSNRRGLTAGQKVSIRAIREIVVSPGMRPSGFKHEAIGVKPI